MNNNEIVNKIKSHLPLRIHSIQWDGTILNMYGPDWNFTTMSAWRLKKNNRVTCGCFDKNSIELIKNINELQIVDFTFTDDSLIDPIFLLSNGSHLEVFATDTYEPWTLHIDQLGSLIPPIT
ncbi:MAG: hypothetical protein WCF65_08110 [Parachlamydiaceae bacterium]